MAGNAAGAPSGRPRRTRNNPSPGGLRDPLPPVTRPRKKASIAPTTALASQVTSHSDSDSADHEGHQAYSQVEDSEDQQAHQAESSTSRSARAFARNTRSASRSVSPSHITAPKGKAKKPLPTTLESPITTSGPSPHQGVGSADTSSRKGKRARNVDSDLSDADDQAASGQRPAKRPRADVDAPWEYFDRSNATPKGPSRSFLNTTEDETPQEGVIEHTEKTPQTIRRLSENTVVRSPINQEVASPERATPAAKKPEVEEQQQHALMSAGASRLVTSPVPNRDPKTLSQPLSLNHAERETRINNKFSTTRQPRFPPNYNRNRHVRESLNLSDDDDDDLPPPRRATAEDVIRHRNIRMAKRNLDAVLDNKQPILIPVEEAKQMKARTRRKQDSKLSASRNSMTPSSSTLKSSPSASKFSSSSMDDFLSAMRPAPSASIAVVRYLKQTGAPFVLDTPPAAEDPLLTAHDWFKENLDFIPTREEQYAMLENYKMSRIQASASSSRNTPNGYNAEDPEDPDRSPPRKDDNTMANRHTPSAQSQTQAATTSASRIPGGFASPVQQREPVTPVHHFQDSEDDDNSMSDTSDREVPFTTTPYPTLTPEPQASAQQPARPAGWVSAVKNIVSSPFKFWAGRSQPAAVSTTDLSRPAFTFDHPSKVPKLPVTPARHGDRPSKSKSESRGPRPNGRSPKKSQPQTEQRRRRVESHLPIEQRGRPDFEAIRRKDEFEAQATLKREEKREAEATKADTDASIEQLPHKSSRTFKVPSCSSSDTSDDDHMDIEDDDFILERMRRGFYDEIPRKLKELEEESLDPPAKKSSRRELVPGPVMVQRLQAKRAEQARKEALIKSKSCEHCDDKDALFDVGPISAPNSPAGKEYLKSIGGFKDPSYYGDSDDSDEDGDFYELQIGGKDDVVEVPPAVPQPSVESSSRVPQPSVESSSRVPQPSVESSSRVPQPSVESSSRVPQPSVESSSRVPQPMVESSSRVPQPSVKSSSPAPQPEVESSSPTPQPKANPPYWTKYHPHKPSQLREVVQMSPLQESTSNIPRFKAVSDVYKALLVNDFVPLNEEIAAGSGRTSRVVVQGREEREYDQGGFRVYGGLGMVS